MGEQMDRDELKARAAELGVEHAPNVPTAKLAELVAEAEAPVAEPEAAEDAGVDIVEPVEGVEPAADAAEGEDTPVDTDTVVDAPDVETSPEPEAEPEDAGPSVMINGLPSTMEIDRIEHGPRHITLIGPDTPANRDAAGIVAKATSLNTPHATLVGEEIAGRSYGTAGGEVRVTFNARWEIQAA